MLSSCQGLVCGHMAEVQAQTSTRLGLAWDLMCPFHIGHPSENIQRSRKEFFYLVQGVLCGIWLVDVSAEAVAPRCHQCHRGGERSYLEDASVVLVFVGTESRTFTCPI